MEGKPDINATRQEKTTLQKIGSAFIPDDVNNIGQYILVDWILPGIWSFVRNGIDTLLPNSKGSGGGQRTASIGSRGGRTANISSQFAYNKVYDQKNRREVEDIGDFSTMMIPNRGDAELVLDEMRDIIADPDGEGCVSIGWFFDRCKSYPIPTASWSWGWRDLRYASVERYGNGYRIKFPKAISLR